MVYHAITLLPHSNSPVCIGANEVDGGRSKGQTQEQLCDAHLSPADSGRHWKEET
jgi:hypothetical protein